MTERARQLPSPSRLSSRASRSWSSSSRAKRRVAGLSDSIEFHAGRGLVGADAADLDLGLEIILAAHRRACIAPQRGNLANVSQRIRDRALKQLLGRAT